MSDAETITLFHSPNTRSTGALILLEELGAPYTLHVLNMKAGEQRQPAFLAVNPLGKVPAIRHRGVLVTEQVAVFIYLATCFRRRAWRRRSTMRSAEPICAGWCSTPPATSRGWWTGP